MATTNEECCIVVGAGDATGSAVTRRFARGGYVVVPVRRSGDALARLASDIEAEGGRCVPAALNARNEDEVIALFDRVEDEIGPVAVTVFNIGGNVRFPFAEIEADMFRRIWETACYSGFLTLREAAKRMAPRGKGAILVTGASASLKGFAGGAAFASAKFALRGMTQALAREMGPAGVHVVHIAIDGMIDTPHVAARFPERYDQKKKDGGLLSPDSIAETDWQLHCQPRDAWTHETELRPWNEGW